MQQENTLKKVREIIGDDIPEAVLQHGVICWKVNTGRKPNQPFLVCEYETFERVCKYLQLTPSHVKGDPKCDSL